MRIVELYGCLWSCNLHIYEIMLGVAGQRVGGFTHAIEPIMSTDTQHTLLLSESLRVLHVDESS